MLLKLVVSFLVQPTQEIQTLVQLEVIYAYKLAGKYSLKFYYFIIDLKIFHFYSNIIHGSDAVESANKEIALWFSEKEVVSWSRSSDSWVYGEN